MSDKQSAVFVHRSKQNASLEIYTGKKEPQSDIEQQYLCALKTVYGPE